MVPLPGVDWLTDVALLLKLIPEINRAFGLTPEQVERLAPDRRIVVYKGDQRRRQPAGRAAGDAGGGDDHLKMVGVRLTTQQAAKYVPLAGQAVSALLTFSALKYVCEQHIRQCMEVSRLLALPARRELTPATTIGSVRGVAQPGSATALGAVGRMFESSHPDHLHLPRCP